jgi:hypothetical protein
MDGWMNELMNESINERVNKSKKVERMRKPSE